MLKIVVRSLYGTALESKSYQLTIIAIESMRPINNFGITVKSKRRHKSIEKKSAHSWSDRRLLRKEILYVPIVHFSLQT